MATARRLTLRDLNRATLARQMLLAREPAHDGGAVPLAVRRLVGLQAQLPGPPYVGLWTRVAPFQASDLASAIAARTVVRATLMRATLHVMAADDYLAFRPVLQPALARALRSLPAERTVGFDVDLTPADGAKKTFSFDLP